MRRLITFLLTLLTLLAASCMKPLASSVTPEVSRGAVLYPTQLRLVLSRGREVQTLPASWSYVVVTVTGNTLRTPQSRSYPTSASTVTTSPGDFSIPPGSDITVTAEVQDAAHTALARASANLVGVSSGPISVPLSLGMLGVYLNALSVPVTSTGGTFSIEAYMGGNLSATVNFPGAASSVSTSGANHLNVTVPAGAASGPFSLTAGGLLSNALPIRITSYTPSIPAGLSTDFEQANTAHASASLTQARAYHASIRLGNYLYVVGGGTAAASSVERATINADGTLGAFTSSGVPALTTNRAHHSIVRIGSYLNVIGGQLSGSGALGSIDQTLVNADGTLSAWHSFSALVTPRYDSASVVIGKYLYVIGGRDSTGTPLSSIEYAPINPDGSFGAFTLAATPLVTARSGHAVYVGGNYVYVVGGRGSTGVLTSVERAPINPDGSLGSFVDVSAVTSLGSYPTTEFSLVPIGQTLFAIGGTNGTSAFTQILQATINPDGALSGSFTPSAYTLAMPRAGTTCQVVGNDLYALGGGQGATPATSPTSSIERGSIDGSGAVANFTSSSGGILPVGRQGLMTFTNGNYLYALGGYDGKATYREVDVAPISPDGTLGSFSFLENLTMPRQQARCVVAGNTVYVIGGFNGTTSLASIEAAPLNPDGTIGSFSAIPTTLTTARYGHSCAILGGYLYVLGGSNATPSVPLGSVEYAPISSNGLGSFAPAGTLVTPRLYHQSVVHGNQLYVIGGLGTTGALTNIEAATLTASGALTFASVSSMSYARSGLGCAVVGNRLYAFGGDTGSGSTSTSEYFTFVSGAPSISTPGPVLTTAIEFFSMPLIGNHLYTIGGYANVAGGANAGVNGAETGLLQ